MLLKEIVQFLEELAPVAIQESYDNCGLISGNMEAEVSRAMVCLDLSDEVMDEAIKEQCTLIVSHHPLIFRPIKKLSTTKLPDRILIKAIKQDIAIYAMHTCFDNAKNGMNRLLADKLGLENIRVLQPVEQMLNKIVTFCPIVHADNVRNAMFSAGAGNIGEYDSCSYNLLGEGTFKGGENTDPFVGEKGALHIEEEIRIETIVPKYLVSKVVKAMIAAHPYEEVAYDIYPLDNKFETIGAGITGTLSESISKTEFFERLKEIFKTPVLKYTDTDKKEIKKIAVCGGSGSFLIPKALAAGVDVFITGDLKYHDYQIPDKKMMLVDVGHFESEQFIKDWLIDVFNKKMPTFAILVSKQEQNPVKYL